MARLLNSMYGAGKRKYPHYDSKILQCKKKKWCSTVGNYLGTRQGVRLKCKAPSRKMGKQNWKPTKIKNSRKTEQMRILLFS